ncbi:MAG TPA: polysaccharide deacetylase family protein [Armatimonadota bacterium]|nr:polysaccharide deacetylase family protein [Armatimonadota bacterium]
MSLITHPSLVLLYHRIGSPLARSTVRGQYVLPALLRWQMRDLLGQGYRPVSLAREMAATEHTAGRFCVTFDDGYSSVRRFACPILQALRVPATIFVVVGAIGKTNAWDEARGDRTEPMMTLDDLKAAAAAGVEIGSHTMTHPRLTTLSDEKLVDEVRSSKHLLEDLLGGPVLGFSYPYGEVDARVRDAVAEAGYRYATTTRLGALVSETDPFLIPRLNIRWNTAGPLLARKIARAYRASVKDHGLLE